MVGRQTSSINLIARCLYGAALAVTGAVLAGLGAKLIAVGGSAYYLPVGLCLVAAGGALFLNRWRAGALIYLGVVLATLVWALGEVGLAGWALVPRLLSPAVLGLPFLLAALAGRRGTDRLAAVLLLAGATALVVAISVNARFVPRHDGAIAAARAGSGAGDDWPFYGGTEGGMRFSRLGQITPANVGMLTVAWRRTVTSTGSAFYVRNQGVPIKIGDALYTCTPYNDVLNLDPETGRIRWRFQAGVRSAHIFQGKCRGVADYLVPSASGLCAHRLFTATIDGRLLALDADTGRPCPSFGVRGSVDLTNGLRQRSPGYYSVTSAPVVVRGRVIVGGSVSDNQYLGEPSGVVRAYDAATGHLVWAWDIGRPEQHAAPAPGRYFSASTPNSWAPMAGDEALGLVYVPTGNATPDYWGGHRSALSNRYASSVVAIDAMTGEPRWSFQTTHYDVWDYDVGSQPVLFDLRTASGRVPALAQGTKRGQLFILDRRTGRPLFPVAEVPSPQSGGVERMAPTQPRSTALPDFAGPPLTERAMWGLTAVDQLWCRIKYREARYAGSMTPPGLTSSIADPGYLGGLDVGSVAIDADRQLALFPSSRIVNYIRLIARSDPSARSLRASPIVNPGGIAAQEGTPFAADVAPFLSPLQVPCQAPPYGMLNALDLRTGKLVWSRPLGSARDLGPMQRASHLPFTIGTPTSGGALATASGLVFVAAAKDHMLRAYESGTGRLLFEADLPDSAESLPMTYRSRSGRQFVVISSEAGAPIDGAYRGAITAFALPR